VKLQRFLRVSRSQSINCVRKGGQGMFHEVLDRGLRKRAL
jgi:hypothetical protein